MNRISSLLAAVLVSSVAISSVACAAPMTDVEASPSETGERPATIAVPERDPSVLTCVTNSGEHHVTAEQCRQLLAIAGCKGGAVVNDTMKCSTSSTEEDPTRAIDDLTAVDADLTRDLATLARAQGTRDGRLVVRDAAGGERELVANGRTYVRGAPVAPGSSFELCRSNQTSCFAIPRPDPSRFECGPDVLDQGNTHCGCVGVTDCVAMATSDVCDGPTECSGNSCTCPF